MKTAMSAPVIWLVLAALADPVAAQVDIARRSPVGDAIEAPKPRNLRPVTRGMRPPSGDERLALVAPKAKMPTARRPEDELAPKPNDIIIDVIVAYTKKAASNYPDIEHELVDLAIGETNKSFRLSNLGHIKLRLVHAYQNGLRRRGRAFRPCLALRRQGRRLHGGDPRPARRSIAPMSRSSLWMTRRAAGWPPECVPTPTRHSPWCITHAPPQTTRSRMRSDISSAQATNSATSTAPSGATSWAPRKAAAAARACRYGRAQQCLIKGEVAGTAILDNARVIAEQAARVAAFR